MQNPQYILRSARAFRAVRAFSCGSCVFVRCLRTPHEPHSPHESLRTAARAARRAPRRNPTVGALFRGCHTTDPSSCGSPATMNENQSTNIMKDNIHILTIINSSRIDPQMNMYDQSQTARSVDKHHEQRLDWIGNIKVSRQTSWTKTR